MPPEPAPAPPPPAPPAAYDFSTPIDIAADTQPDALRRVARARSNCSSVGCEVIVLHGGANAGVINLQLNLLRLRWTNTWSGGTTTSARATPSWGILRAVAS